MKINTFLLLIIVMMQLSMLINITVFEGQWNGIVLALHTVLFILAFAMYVDGKKEKK
ncbi:hypothetical protein [Radiobacillus sp. PE A8.2]|uniref:hypothetical protein n=1 Tax=Radiobacillus sp. PE A8.2 TaxID=3380349 RepID=UPI003890EFA0